MSRRIKWHQRLHWDAELVDPEDSTWEEAARLIRALNGRQPTDVFLGKPDDWCEQRYLSVSGGNAGRYLVMAQELKCYFCLVRRPDPAKPLRLLEVGISGLPSYYPAILLSSLSAALSAAEHYFRSGRRTRRLSWMRGDVAQRLCRRAEAHDRGGR